MSKKTCFFVTPIGSEDSPERKISDKVYKNLLLPSLSADFDIIRVDHLNIPDNINNTIIEYLNDAELVIVDMTNHNPNVFYEFGYRHATKKPVVPIIMKDTTQIPFDVSSLRTIFYSFDVEDINSAKTRLSETVDAFDFSVDSQNSPQHTNQDITQISLLKMSDKLDEIYQAIVSRNDSETDKVAQVVAKYAQPEKSMEAVMMETLLPLMIQDPDKIQELAKRFSWPQSSLQ